MQTVLFQYNFEKKIARFLLGPIKIGDF